MSNIERISNTAIRTLITDTEKTLDDLKAELHRREEAAQDVEIEHLEDHMKNAEVSLKTIRDFVKFLVSEFRLKK